MKGTWRRRYRRLLDLPPGMLRGRILYRAKLPIFAGSLYDRLLLGRHAPMLTALPADPWPADPARGREIATRLYLSERTAQNHVQRILTKLDLPNRSQIAVWITSRS